MNMKRETIHIVEVPSFFMPYGGEFCLEQAKALKAQGHEVRIVSNVQLSLKRSIREFVTMPSARKWIQVEGIDVLQSYQRGLPRCIRWNMKRWVAIAGSMLDEYVAKYGKPDIIHAHCAKWAGYAAMLAARKYGIGYVITEHMPVMNYEEEFGPAPSNTWQIGLLKEAYHEAAMVIPVAEELVEQTACYFGRDYRWKAVSNVIDTDFFHYVERSAPKPFKFVCPALFTERKGYDVLLAAFDQMKEKQVELHIAGSGTDSERMRRMVDGCKAKDRVILHGALDKEGMRSLYGECHAVALATRSEVQPLALLEAMSTGIPYISTTAVPQSERFEGAGVTVPIDDVAAFAQAMDSMVTTKSNGRLISEKTRQMASPAVVAQQLEAIFRTAIDKDACNRTAIDKDACS